MGHCDFKFDIIIIGEAGSGKTCLARRFANHRFDNMVIPTIGVDFYKAEVRVDGKTVSLQIWDTAGQEQFTKLNPQFFRKKQGVVVVYDVTDRTSFEQLEVWLEKVEEECDDDIVKLLVGNKDDVRGLGKVVDRREAEKFGADRGIDLVEASAKADMNVNKVFEVLARKLIEKAPHEQPQQNQTVVLHKTPTKSPCRGCCGRS